MKKIQILALEGFKRQIIKRLQELGTVHLTDYSEKLDDHNLKDLLWPHPQSTEIRKITAQNITVNRLLDLFERFNPEPKEGFFKGIFAPSEPKKIETKEIYGSDLSTHVDNIIVNIEQEVKTPVRELEKIEEEIDQSEKTRRSLDLVLPMEIDLKDAGESEFLAVFLGLVPKEDVESINEKLKEITGGIFYLGLEEKASEEKAVAVLICLKEQAPMVLASIRRLNWERIEIEGQRGRPSEAIKAINEKLEGLLEEKAGEEAKIEGIARKWKDELKKCQEFLLSERQREESQAKFASTDTVVAIEGWVPQTFAEQVAHEIRNVSNGACAIEIVDPEENDNVPVQLKNPVFVRSFELLTRLYGMPVYKGVDPTLFLVPGFLLFFSIMLTDALYGVIALILGVLLIRGGGRYNQFVKDGGVVLSSAGAATVVIGALSGGWFGDFGLKIPVLSAIQVFDPMVQVTAFLLIALIIGLVHVNTGVIIQVVDSIKKGKLRNAIGENLWFLTTQPGIVLYLFGYKTAGLIFIVISLILLLLGHKAMSMFQVTGFMGDVLSYARLMALGLCTTGIAMTVNVLSGMLYKIGFIGVLFAVIVFFIGHIFNFVINAMGSFVHGLRLHYVEFFTKFYQSGGSEFEPLRNRFELIEIK